MQKQDHWQSDCPRFMWGEAQHDHPPRCHLVSHSDGSHSSVMCPPLSGETLLTLKRYGCDMHGGNSKWKHRFKEFQKWKGAYRIFHLRPPKTPLTISEMKMLGPFNGQVTHLEAHSQVLEGI